MALWMCIGTGEMERSMVDLILLDYEALEQLVARLARRLGLKD